MIYLYLLLHIYIQSDLGKEMEKSINFGLVIDGWLMDFNFDTNILNISGINLESLQTSNGINKSYNAYYEDLSLPEDIYKELESVEKLTKFIQKYQTSLRIHNDSLLIEFNKFQKPYILPLISKQQQLQFIPQAALQNHPFQIQPVLMEKYDNLPYSAVVYIMAYCSGNATIQSSGVLIGKTTILTVAHAVYNRQHDLEAESIIAYVYKNGSLEMLPIKKHHFRQEYKTTNLADLPKYDFAILQLEENNIVTSNMILKIKWNWQNSQLIQITGFSIKLDKSFSSQNILLYHMKCKTIAKFQTFLTYMNKAQSGISGAPIIIKQEEEYFIIGLHQGLHVNISRGLLLSSFSQNPYQILRTLFVSSSIQLQIIEHAQSQWQMLRLHPQVKKMSNQIKKLQQQNDYLKNKESPLQSFQLVKDTKQKIQFYFTKGEQLLEQKKYSEAEKSLLKCFQLSEKNTNFDKQNYFQKTLFLLGKIKMNQKNYKEAIKQFQKIMLSKSTQKNQYNSVQYIKQMGICFYYLNDNKKAQTTIQRCKRMLQDSKQTKFQNYKEILELLGQIQLENGEVKIGLKNFQYVLQNFDKQMKDWRNLFNIATALQLLCKVDEAEKYYKKIQDILFVQLHDKSDFNKKIYKKEATNQYYKGEILLAKRQYKDALKKFQACQTMYEDDLDQDNFFILHVKNKQTIAQSKLKNSQ